MLIIFVKINNKQVKFYYDILVIGAGHAGCEAAAAAAKLGAKTCLMTMDMNKIAQMSCNPAIGGIAKGQIVKEIDALGGYMGIVTDKASIQFRMLNRSKGPAMWSPRAQCDRVKYSIAWREILENIPNLHMWQDCATELITQENKAIGVRTQLGAEFYAKCTILTAGTFLNGLMHIGKVQIEGGRISEPASKGLTESIEKLGIRAGRMKTGTPVRLDRRSIHTELTDIQHGDNDFHKFSFTNTKRELKQRPCWGCYTNPEVHKILHDSLDDSPLYNGQIQSINRKTLWAITHDAPTGGAGYKTALPPQVADSIKKSYFLLENLWESYMNSGKINPVSGIFLGKNNFGYQDKTEYVVTPNTQRDEYDPEDIRRRYLGDSTIINSED